MPVETATYISQLDPTNPLGSDAKSQGDNHLRLIKQTLKNTLPNWTATPLVASNAQLDKLVTSLSVNAGAPAGVLQVDVAGNIGFNTAVTSWAYDFLKSGSASATVEVMRAYANASANARSRITYGTAANAANSATAGLTSSATGGSFIIQTSQEGTGSLTDRITWDSTGNAGANVAPPNYGAGILSYALNAPIQPIWDLYVAGVRTASVTTTAVATNIGSVANIPVNLIQNGATKLTLDVAGTVSYGGIEIGYRGIPRVTSGLERGKAYAVSGSISIPATANAGDTYMVVNRTGSSVTLTPSGITLINAATGASGAFTLTNNNFCTIWFDTTTVALVK